MNDNSADRLNDDEVRAVIARAMELEGRGLTTVAELRAIASEIGISPDAVEAALEERMRGARPAPFAASRSMAPTPFAVFGVGLPLGVAAGALLVMAGPLIGVGAIGLMAAGFAASGVLIVKLGKKATIGSFQVRNTLLWAGLGIGGVVTASLFPMNPLGPGLIVGWCLRSWVTSSILGSAAVIAIRGAAADDANAGPPTPQGGGSAPRRLRNAVKRVADWLLRPFRREGQKLGSLVAWLRAGPPVSAGPPAHNVL